MPSRRRKKKTTTVVEPAQGPEPQPSRGALLWPAASLLLPLGLFSFTFCRSPYWGDSTELALVARAAGVAHPTGYPLYLVLGRLWTALVPLHDIAWRNVCQRRLELGRHALAGIWVEARQRVGVARTRMRVDK